MSAYLITGGSGAGKSTVIEELARRGYQTHTDEDPSLAGFYDAAGKRLPHSDWPQTRPFDFDHYKWEWHLPELKKLISGHHGTLIVGGATWNTGACLHLFDAVFVLQPSLDTLKQRLKTRSNNNFGKYPEELDHILENFDPTGDFWRAAGAIIIDANRPVVAVTDDILSHIGKKAAA